MLIDLDKHTLVIISFHISANLHPPSYYTTYHLKITFLEKKNSRTFFVHRTLNLNFFKQSLFTTLLILKHRNKLYLLNTHV